MEYHQITLIEWIDMKKKLQAELLGIKRSFVRVGFLLRKIDESKGYENDGYKSIAEWAEREYGLERTTVSRFMAINREYSVDGFSEQLLPEYEDFKRSQLEEMLKLPTEDRQMISPETPRTDIRELKKFNKEQPAAGIADDEEEFLEHFIEDNWELAVELEGMYGDADQIKEAMIPSGNRTYRKGLYFMTVNENKVSVKKYGQKPEEYSWEQFTQILSDIFEKRNEREEENRNHVEVEEDEIAKEERVGESDQLEEKEAENEEEKAPVEEIAPAQIMLETQEDARHIEECDEGDGESETELKWAGLARRSCEALIESINMGNWEQAMQDCIKLKHYIELARKEKDDFNKPRGYRPKGFKCVDTNVSKRYICNINGGPCCDCRHLCDCRKEVIEW